MAIRGMPELYLKHDYTASDHLPLVPEFHPVYACRYEPLKQYRVGGFCPVHLGDVIHGRYEVVHKLGFGGSSTVWLVKDVVRNRYCALKILKASIPPEDASREIHILRELRRKRHRNYPWMWNAVAGQEAYRAASRNSIFPLLYDQFIIKSPNGRHSCLVTEALGCSLHNVLRHVNYFKLTPILTLSIIMRMAKIMRSMHANGVVHGGAFEAIFASLSLEGTDWADEVTDIHSGNVMFSLQDEKALTKERVERLFGCPCPIPVSDIDPVLKHPGVPRHLVPTAPLTESIFKLLQNSTIKLVDYGDARRPHIDGLVRIEHLPHNIAPEIAFGEKVCHATDIWALGCMFFEMIAGHPPFVGWSLDDYLADIILAYGKPLPARWWKKWDGKRQFFDMTGAWISTHEKSPIGDLSFGQRLRNAGVANFGGRYWKEYEYVVLEKLLRSMLEIDPKKRILCGEIYDYFPDAWKESPPRRVKPDEFAFETKAPCENRDSAELCA